jgi:hypothetical protein
MKSVYLPFRIIDMLVAVKSKNSGIDFKIKGLPKTEYGLSDKTTILSVLNDKCISAIRSHEQLT